MAKRSPENQRRKLIDEQRRKARATERRKTILTIVLSTLLGAGLIGGSVYFSVKSKNKTKPSALTAIGVSKDEAGCLDVKEDPIPKDATDATKHTARDGDHVDYTLSPPTSGRHNPTPLPGVGVKKFYTREENPPPERAVHNLEHGYTVVWYDKTVSAETIELLKKAGESGTPKLLLVPWDRADFPDDKHIVITSWGQREQCSNVSGEVIQAFVDEHGGANSKAPEKNAA